MTIGLHFCKLVILENVQHFHVPHASYSVLDDFYEYRQSCDDGCRYRSDILFVLTDGTPTTASGHAACPDLEVRLENSNVDIVLILIGESQDDIDDFIDDVSCLDIGSNGTDIYEVIEFTDAAFRQIESLIRDKTCNGTSPVCE